MSVIFMLSKKFGFKDNGNTFREGISAKIILTPFWEEVYSTRKQCSTKGSKLFPLKVHPFSEGVWWSLGLIGSHKICSFMKKKAENSSVSSPLIRHSNDCQRKKLFGNRMSWISTNYSKTSMARTRIAHLLWVIRIHFRASRIFFDISRKRISLGYLKENFLFCHENVWWVYSLESPYRGDSNKYTQHTIIV